MIIQVTDKHDCVTKNDLFKELVLDKNILNVCRYKMI